MLTNPYVRSVLAVPQGLRMCLFEQRLRRLAMRPWLIGIISYIITLAISIHYHAAMVEHFTPAAGSWWGMLVYGFVWAIVTVLLLLISMAVSLVAVMVLAGYYQTAIAEEVTRSLGLLPSQPSETSIASVSGSILTEGLKFLFLLPLILLAFVLAFLPLLAPVALVIGAWLLAFQFIDLVFEAHQLPLTRRFGLAFKKVGVFICFGLALSFFWAVPFLGLLLLPAAAAGAAWLFATPALSCFLPTEPAAHSSVSQ